MPPDKDRDGVTGRNQGIGVSAGIGIGRAVVLRGEDLDYSMVVPKGSREEKRRLHEAIASFRERTERAAEETRARAGEKQAEILLAQIMMIGDPFMVSQMEDLIGQGACAEKAVDTVCGMYIEMFTSVEDEVTRQRATDVRDMRARLLGLLLGQPVFDPRTLPAGSVLVVHDLTPSMTSGLGREQAAALVAETGGMTSHSAILARAMSIPAVLGLSGVTERIADGDLVIVDGTGGVVLPRPDSETLDSYRLRQEKLLADRAALEAFREAPTRTADHHEVLLCCNIGSDQDVKAVLESGGEGIGLFRTEFLFMDRSAPPGEAEQFEVYRRVVETVGEREVVIRTLDIGGDKAVGYLGMEREENPFLGYRGIRYCLGRPDFFSVQLRALLRASAFGRLKIMVPIVTCADELRQTRAILSRLMADLEQEGVPFQRGVPLGIMIETPAAALIADILARESDFFSIGTNDLVQYTMAVDRGNGKVAYLYSPLNPSVLRSIRSVIRAGHEAGIPVGMCGESAADSRLIPLLLAFGLDEFSVGASSVLETRRAISRWTLTEARHLADEVMKLSSADGIEAYLSAAIEDRR